MKDLLDAFNIEDENVRMIALALDKMRDKNVGEYVRFAARINGSLRLDDYQGVLSDLIHYKEMVSIHELAVADFEAFKMAWKQAIRLVRQKWGVGGSTPISEPQTSATR